MKKILTFLTAALFFLLTIPIFASGFEDEPDELCWDRLGGTEVSLRHFLDFCKADPEFRAKLLEKPALCRLPDEVPVIWVMPQAFAERPNCGWTLETSGPENEPVLTMPAGHGTQWCRVAVEIPSDGFYRIWARYFHIQGTTASFLAELEDERLADMENRFQSVAQNVVSHRFDFAELARRSAPLPNFSAEPTGFRWESSPLVWLEAGTRTLTISGMIHGGPYAPRRLAAVALTQDPFAIPQKPKQAENPQRTETILTANVPLCRESLETRELLVRRPMDLPKETELSPLWNEWRKVFLNALLEGRLEGVEAGRMAGMVWFDPESNLIGTPRQVADEKKRMKDFFASADRSRFTLKIEAEDFRILGNGRSSWSVQHAANASGGRELLADYGGGLAEAETTVNVPHDGVFRLWCRYSEINGYLAPYGLKVLDPQRKTVGEMKFAHDAEFNGSRPGENWLPLNLSLKKGTHTLRLFKEVPGQTYRHFDALILTDDPNFVPEGHGEILPPLTPAQTQDPTRPLTVWRQNDPWLPFSRLSVPKAGEGLDPLELELRKDCVETLLLHVRNESPQPCTFTPEIHGDPAGLISWRLPAYVLTDRYGWQPVPLLKRRSITVPPGETASLWLTIDGRKTSGDENVRISVEGETFSLAVRRRGILPQTHVPLVFGWARPFKTISCWERFADLGLNVVSGVVLPEDESQKYGIRLWLTMNDENVEPDHIAQVESWFTSYGIPYTQWAWSFMDEPGNASSDRWVELAQAFRAANRKIRIWVNPGEIEGAGPESTMKMTPHVQCFCPYQNHFLTDGGRNEEYARQLRREEGAKVDLLMGYSTPCGHDMAPSMPYEMLGMKDFALRYGLDGWGFFALISSYEYSNSIWDNQTQYLPDQSILLYRGAAFQTISTRSAEAVREAVQRWKTERSQTKK